MGNENKENTMKPDNAGEFILKGTALTLSSKGVTDDLKEVLKIKIDYVKCNSLIGSLVEKEQSLSEEQKALFLTETDNIVYQESSKIR